MLNVMGPRALEYAKKECTIHQMMRHENIVKLHNYTENEEEFVMFMEYCNTPDYFEQKIIEVTHFTINYFYSLLSRQL
jgi:serine/threonine protein kinase